eukprot:m.17740 g.17740  ORF g.17740 m.17740 type:complete len:236 (-) comp9416_c0_seq1:202-909(-)
MAQFLFGLTALCLATTTVVTAQPGSAKLPTWTTWSASVTSELIEPGKLPQKRKGFTANQDDSTRNMSAWLGQGQTYVADFNAQTVAFTQCNTKTNVCECQYTCKLMDETPCQTQLNGAVLCGYDYEHRAKFIANETIDGVPTMHFRFADPLGPISMADHDIYFTLDLKTVVRYSANLHPFLKEVGRIISDYTNFSAAPPDASAFAYTNAKYCPDQSDEPSCQDTIREARASGFRL